MKDNSDKTYCRHPKSFVIKNGIRRNRFTDSQQYKCKQCGKKFTKIAKKYYKKKFPKLVILEAIKLVKKGNSLRITSEKIRDKFGINVNFGTVKKWVNEYCKTFKIPHSRPMSPETKKKISIAIMNRR